MHNKIKDKNLFDYMIQMEGKRYKKETNFFNHFYNNLKYII